MLLRYGAKNFCCFRDWMEIDLTFNEKVAKEVRFAGDVARAICLKGGNSSGKTSALKVLSFVASVTAHSFNLKPEEEFQLDTFFENKGPSEFFMDFRIGVIEYSYELVTTTKAIHSEKLYRKDKRKTLVLSRNGTKIERNSLFDAKKAVTVRENASIISTSKQYEIPEMDSIYMFFSQIASNVNYSGLRHEILNYSASSEVYEKSKEILEFAKTKIIQFDTGIKDIRISSYVNDKNEKVFFPIFTHERESETGELLYHSQSSGTKALYRYLLLYYVTLRSGGILVLDEFDINLHPDILPHLVALFDDKEANPDSAQLIFSTHNTDVLDFMGKYRTYLFNKELGASYCYRLDELPPNLIRNDRSIASLYRSGRLGGVPKV